MRFGLIVLFVAFLVAAIAGQYSIIQSTEAQDDNFAITACAVQGNGCGQPPLDSSPGTLVLDHVVYSGGCGSVDLHVVRYVPADSASGESVIAQWCS